jgi:2-oxoglutarate dehydrogenase E2 component (dihydrolipoamide succinyltransferase)
MIEVKVPSVGESITQGVIGRWAKKSGDYVTSGEVLFEIETEKVTSEVFAAESGSFQTLVEAGATVQIGQVVARIDETATAPAKATPAAVTPPPPSPTPPTIAKTEPPKAAAPSSPMPLSPGVRYAVAERGLNPEELSGTGKGGRLTVGDALNPVSATSLTPQAQGPRQTRKPMSQLRQKIAARLVSAQAEAALLTTFNECDMTNVMALRARFQERFQAKHGLKLGFMSFFVKAAVAALHQVPSINAQINGTDIVQNHYYDISVAVSTEKGLFVPVVRDCDHLNFAQIEQAIGAYAKKAKDGKITLPDMEGGVFTITNGGTFGSMLSTPIINPPQSAILGMHSILERPMAINGQVVIRPMMYLALSYDHRIVDGKDAVTFLVRLKEFIENPGVALLDL